MTHIPAHILERLATAQRITVLSGPGLATECGLPTPEGARVGQFAKYALMELATPQAFLRNPRLVWQWYAYRRELAEQANPGSSHYALVDFEQNIPEFMLITQTVDSLHWRAGSRALIELHGSICRVRCFECGSAVESWDDENEVPPPCPHCGGWLRPDVVLYGEGMPSGLVAKAYHAAEQAEVFISIGCTATAQPAVRLPLLARRAGAFLLEINPEETALSVLADEHLAVAPASILPLLVEQLWGGLQSQEEGA
jgi:NAD-dependent deacetylase